MIATATSTRAATLNAAPSAPTAPMIHLATRLPTSAPAPSPLLVPRQLARVAAVVSVPKQACTYAPASLAATAAATTRSVASAVIAPPQGQPLGQDSSHLYPRDAPPASTSALTGTGAATTGSTVPRSAGRATVPQGTPPTLMFPSSTILTITATATATAAGSAMAQKRG